MIHEITSTLRETVVNVSVTGEDVPVVENSRGYSFTPKSVHMLWTQQNADAWSCTYVELKGTLANNERVSRTYWSEVTELPEWLRAIVEETTPIEALTERVA